MPRPATGLNTVSRRRPDGTVEFTWYHRKSGLLIGKSRDGWTKEAALERAASMDAEEVKAGPPSGSFGELCAFYLSDPRFVRKAEKTKRDYRKHIELMRGMWEAIPVTGITRKVVRALHAQYQDRPWQGNALLRTLRLLMNFGIHDLEMPGLTKNPADRPSLYETRARDQIWDQHRIDAFMEAARDYPALRRAFALLLYTVQRPSDVLTMARPMVFERDGRIWIRLRQAKTGALVDVPCHERLSAELVAPNSGGTMLLVSSPRGKPWSYRNFARAWDRVRRLANWRLARAAIVARGGLPPRSRPKEREAAKKHVRAQMLADLQRRDLRRTGMVQLAIAGATTPQIAALSGHSIDQAQKILDTYLPRRGEVALGGIEKWEDGGDRVVVLAKKRR
ncbi:integrase [Pseudoroseomonas wenyumeiae]|uniref:Integrase n=1 Tax=Teichococcus wenyumeiae TaxID=2478470 RepID=A0A3A9JJR6_9PROT|nr:integrase [Pseudoroseomonas wenyumeiae]RKK04006.1 integrase [Pseudoroseomonas wenyumeiae]RMI19404.1 integrase [Pseudoroseomonas wenyumeiae]RMI20285.1 integrase [Pseudoroseomonas wenyumeiae]